ncbi:MAG TPA: hypothetical protein VLX28_01120 [Thermoanaerobaculia bacterium]|nr:hypothetical protein [Thermoanaerobaculia bacterium]
MNEIDRQNLGSDAAALMGAGAVGAITLGSVAHMLSRSSGASPSLEMGGILLGGLLGVAAAVAVIRRRAVVDSKPALKTVVAPDWHEDPSLSSATGFLLESLGAEVTTYLSGAENVKTVERWATGELKPDPISADRLRCAFEVAFLIVDAYDGETARVWFCGMNQRLNDEAPAEVLRKGTGPADWRAILPSACEFVESAR